MKLLFDLGLQVRGVERPEAFVRPGLFMRAIIIVFGAYELPLVGWQPFVATKG
jgi:hypothetical protein